MTDPTPTPELVERIARSLTTRTGGAYGLAEPAAPIAHYLHVLNRRIAVIMWIIVVIVAINVIAGIYIGVEVAKAWDQCQQGTTVACGGSIGGP